MKKIILITIMAIMGVCATNAQLVKSRTFTKIDRKINGYNRISVGYDALFLSKGMEDLDSHVANGFNILYSHGWGLSRKYPLFLEGGIGLGYNVASEKEDYGDRGNYTEKVSTLWFKIPININYKFNIAENIALQPYTGINFKINATLKDKYTEVYQWDYSEEDNDLMKDGGKRFQFGWQIGVGVDISKFYVGIQYGLDFLPLYEAYNHKVNTSNLSVNLGYTW